MALLVSGRTRTQRNESNFARMKMGVVCWLVDFARWSIDPAGWTDDVSIRGFSGELDALMGG